MRKIVVGAFVSLDGVMQAPGGPAEDPTGGFRFGGWMAPFGDDDAIGASLGETFSAPFDLLLGRRTYDIFAAYWPYIERDPASPLFAAENAHIAERFDAVTKHVATHRPDSLRWKNSRSLGPDAIAGVRELARGEGPMLLTLGSTELVHLLFEHDLVDELRLITFPVVLGRGKRLFSHGSAPRSLAVKSSAISKRGVVVATYERAGEVRTATFETQPPSDVELERRRAMVGQ
jgi:dihydrofolate reductase